MLEPDALIGRAQELAREIADNTSQVSVALIRQMMWRMSSADHPMSAHRIDSRLMQETGRTTDAQEGIESFLEKRPARFPQKVSRDMPPSYPWWEEPDFN